MTLVLPFGVDQLSYNNLNSTMPCVFDNDSIDDAFDREIQTAFMRDWSAGLADYEMSAETATVKSPSETTKRKHPSFDDEIEEHLSKKSRFEDDDDISTSVPSGLLSPSPPSSSSSSESSSMSSSSSVLESPIDASSISSSTSSSDVAEEEPSPDVEDEETYTPRRRGIQMWSSRQKWKDERKKVLKMSIAKLSEIEDPELCLFRSVLINNTIKKLHSDIKNERQEKLRQKQQRLFFAERFSLSSTDSEQFTPDFICEPDPVETKPSSCQPPTAPVSASDFYDDNSCDEIFGLGEDFLRVPIPDRRVSSPIPVSSSARDQTRDSDRDSEDSPMDVSVSSTTTSTSTCPLSCYNSLPSCDTAVGCSPPFYHRQTPNSSPSASSTQAPEHLQNQVSSTSPGDFQTAVSQSSANPQTMVSSSFPYTPSSGDFQTVVSQSSANPQTMVSSSFPYTPPSLKDIIASVSYSSSNSGGQCATQYRTNHEFGVSNRESFRPTVPILDEVVYHSLLASMDSS